MSEHDFPSNINRTIDPSFLNVYLQFLSSLVRPNFFLITFYGPNDCIISELHGRAKIERGGITNVLDTTNICIHLDQY